MSLVKGLLELGDVVVEQLEVVGDLFFAADRRHKYDDLPAVSRAIEFGVFKSKYGSTMMTLTPSRFMSPINSTVCWGLGGMPGRGST